jgi:hypothetical protein
MSMYLQKMISKKLVKQLFFVVVLKVTDPPLGPRWRRELHLLAGESMGGGETQYRRLDTGQWTDNLVLYNPFMTECIIENSKLNKMFNYFNF